MTIYGKTLEIKNVTEGYTKEQIEQNIEMFTEQRNEALYDLYEMKRETLAFNEGGNKEGYCDLLDDTDFLHQQTLQILTMLKILQMNK